MCGGAEESREEPRENFVKRTSHVCARVGEVVGNGGGGRLHVWGGEGWGRVLILFFIFISLSFLSPLFISQILCHSICLQASILCTFISYTTTCI